MELWPMDMKLFKDYIYIVDAFNLSIFWVKRPITFDYQAIPNDDGFIMEKNTSNTYFEVDLTAEKQYAIVMIQNCSYNLNESYSGRLSLSMYKIEDIIDLDNDNIADIQPYYNQNIIEDFTNYEETYNTEYLTVYINETGTYAIYLEKYEQEPIKVYLYIQGSPGCFLAKANFSLNKSMFIPENGGYTTEEVSLIYHIPGYKFRLRAQKQYRPDDDYLNDTNHFSFLEFSRSTQTFNANGERIDGYLRIDLPWLFAWGESGGLATCQHGIMNISTYSLKREDDQKTINFTAIYDWNGDYGGQQGWKNQIQHTYLFNYRKPGYVKIKQNQVFQFNNMSIYEPNNGEYTDGFIMYIKFLPYYSKTINGERIDISPKCEDYLGWYETEGYDFASMVYADTFDMYLSNGTKTTEQIMSFVDNHTNGKNYTWWNQRFPQFPKTIPINRAFPDGNVTKIFYDPDMHYYFDIPSWLLSEIPETQPPPLMIPGYHTFSLILTASLISIIYILMRSRKKILI
jgi:hypothetical protein